MVLYYKLSKHTGRGSAQFWAVTLGGGTAQRLQYVENWAVRALLGSRRAAPTRCSYVRKRLLTKDLRQELPALDLEPTVSTRTSMHTLFCSEQATLEDKPQDELPAACTAPPRKAPPSKPGGSPTDPMLGTLAGSLYRRNATVYLVTLFSLQKKGQAEAGRSL